MRSHRFLKIFSSKSPGIITPGSATKVTGYKKTYAYTYLNRLVNRGELVRVEKGKYALPDTTAPIVASNLVHPSYISLLFGLFMHHRTSQIPVVIDVISPVSKRNVDYNGYNISFVKLPQRRMFGYASERAEGNMILSLGSLEKVIVDCLYLPKYCPLQETYSAIREGVDLPSLIEIGIRMSSCVTLKRLGYILNTLDIDIYEDISKYLNYKFDPLDPTSPTNGRDVVKDRKWHLLINTILNTEEM